MVLSADEYSKRATFYAKAADGESTSRTLRMVFARKANWLRILARLEGNNEQSCQSATRRQNKRACGEKVPGRVTGSVAEALLFSPGRLAAARRSKGLG